MKPPVKETHKLPPARIIEILRNAGPKFTMDSGETTEQIVTAEELSATGNTLVYRYTQLVPEKILKTIDISISLAAQQEGSLISLSGKMTSYEVPPGRAHQMDDMDISHETTTTWTYLRNVVAKETSKGRVETADRSYNASIRELFTLLKNPVLLSPAYYVVAEQDEENGFVSFQDPTGSLKYSVRRLEFTPYGHLVYYLESNTSNMYTRSGRVEIALEKVNEAKTKIYARAVPEPTKLSAQMEMSSMYLQPEQLQMYLSFKQDLQMLVAWIDAAVPLQIPHIRDMIVVQGDFVAGSKVEIKDSVLNRTAIQTGAVPDDGRFLVHSDTKVDSKVTITDSVVNRSTVDTGQGIISDSVVSRNSQIGAPKRLLQQDIADNKNVEVYLKSLEAAYADGLIDGSEASMMDTLQKSFGITPAQHLMVMETIGALKGDSVDRYAQILQTTLNDRGIDASEEAILNTLRQQFRIPLIVHQALVTKLTMN